MNVQAGKRCQVLGLQTIEKDQEIMSFRPVSSIVPADLMLAQVKRLMMMNRTATVAGFTKTIAELSQSDPQCRLIDEHSGRRCEMAAGHGGRCFVYSARSAAHE